MSKNNPIGKDGRLRVYVPGRDMPVPGGERAALAAGFAVQAYYSFQVSRFWAAEVAGDLAVEVWYTERHGDPITMIVPAGTPRKQLPKRAIDYIALEWIAPEAEFSRRPRA